MTKPSAFKKCLIDISSLHERKTKKIQLSKNCTVTVLKSGKYVFSKGCPEKLRKAFLEMEKLMEKYGEDTFKALSNLKF